MTSQAQNGTRWRNSAFERSNGSPSPGPPPGHVRSKSTITGSPISPPIPGHTRNQSLAADFGRSTLGRSNSKRPHTAAGRAGSPSVGTFAPKFIKAEGLDGTNERVGGIEGENDFSGKRYVWLRDPETAFVRGWVVEELSDNKLRVQCDNGSVREEVAHKACAY